MGKKTNQLYVIDFLKFALLFPILIYHLFGEFAFKFTSELRPILSTFFTARNGYIAADLFFIISGYFLYKSVLKNPEINLQDFAIKRLKRLLPILFVSILLIGIFNLNYNNNYPFNFYNLLYQICLLQTTGISKMGNMLNPYTWYIATLFWSSIFYFLIIKCFPKIEQRQLIFLLFIFIGYTAICNHGGFQGFHRKIFQDFFSGGIIRAIASMGVGCLISTFDIKKPIENLKNKIIYSILEVFLYFELFYNLIFHTSKKYDAIFLIIMFCALFIISLKDCGIISRLLNKIKFKNAFGYSIYVCHWFTYLMLLKYGFFNTELLNKKPFIIYLAIFFALIAGTVIQLGTDKLSKLFRNRERERE